MLHVLVQPIFSIEMCNVATIHLICCEIPLKMVQLVNSFICTCFTNFLFLTCFNNWLSMCTWWFKMLQKCRGCKLWHTVNLFIFRCFNNWLSMWHLVIWDVAKDILDSETLNFHVYVYLANFSCFNHPCCLFHFSHAIVDALFFIFVCR